MAGQAVRGEPFAIAEQVDYQDGAVVSRTIVKAERGSITAFAFDAGQELSEHSVPYDVLAHVVDGEGELRVDGEAHRVAAGEAIVLPGGRPHAVRAVTRFKMVLTMIRP